MKKLFLLACIIFLGFQLAMSQEKLSGPFTLKVDVSTLKEKPGKLFYSYYNTASRESMSDSAEVTGKEVKFKGNLEEPVLVSLRYVPAPTDKKKISGAGNVFGFYLEPGEVKVSATDSLSNSVVKGSNTQIEYEKMLAVRKPLDEKQKVLFAAYSDLYAKKDSVGLLKNAEQRKALSEEMVEKVYKPFYLEYATKSPVAIRMLRYLGVSNVDEYPKAKEYIAKLDPRYRALPSVQTMEYEMSVAEKTAIGAYAMDFTQNDTLGMPVSLSSFRGRYVLVDFWASWCGPCRKENPNLIKSFASYKDKNFTILGVSLDQPGKKDKWIKAIHDDKLTWTHVSDLKYWANAVAKMYAINGIPANLLIDPQGKIIAKDLRGADLDKKLEEVLGKHISSGSN